MINLQDADSDLFKDDLDKLQDSDEKKVSNDSGVRRMSKLVQSMHQTKIDDELDNYESVSDKNVDDPVQTHEMQQFSIKFKERIDLWTK